MLNLDGIRLVDSDEAEQIIATREPHGAFLEIDPDDGAYVAIDNTEGCAWTEEFDMISDAVLYLSVNASEGME